MIVERVLVVIAVYSTGLAEKEGESPLIPISAKNSKRECRPQQLLRVGEGVVLDVLAELRPGARK